MNEHNEQRRILIAGGAGFLGAHLCRRMLNEGHRVICLDNYCTGSPDKVADLAGRDGFTLIRHDIVEPLPPGLDPTHIYNLACPASPVHYQRDPIQTLRSCVVGGYHLLELARRSQARILQASTSEVYGNPKTHPQHESYHGHVNPVGLRSCYDEGKRCAETLFADYSRAHGVQVKIARIFNTYGPGMSVGDGRVISNLITQALAGRPLTIYGDGNQTRSFCYVDDMIEGLVRLMDSVDTFMGPVNLGNTSEIAVIEVAQRILELTGREEEFEFVPLPPDDPALRCPDTTLAKSHLDWFPAVPLDEGLRHTIAYFSELVGHEQALARAG
ncbi:UDP-glucuronic acid decarboxylase family protein [Parapusillimonas granuli]|uniref:SDR family oxidoreductase n=1 Tax=Parapusillimonas granuli TaxID=380911 RepID=A0A853FXQ8_9BURK|nr:UDP-glucuronic acid decarboxylase family protein [Parapusillimonas granuli]MBB5215897.1 UDP-glucuronate decarboxylase [Parapusillimonas granuli]MEB2399412.1 SDR family oxidoreductase [Alcaligenaceae bacterium]NYT50805.1 SDR family oxidoreductase [Parapusillimonas granuli]